MNEETVNETKSEEEQKFRLRTIALDTDVSDLRKPSDPVSEAELSSADTKELIQALKDYVTEHQGLGMAAVQLGVHKRIFVMRQPFSSDRLTVVINPRILRGTGHSVKAEGCFSLPDVPADPMVKRSSMIFVNYTDENGVLQEEEMLVGMDARIFQHELDHLDGILMVDAKPNGRGFQRWKRSF